MGFTEPTPPRSTRAKPRWDGNDSSTGEEDTLGHGTTQGSGNGRARPRRQTADGQDCVTQRVFSNHTVRKARSYNVGMLKKRSSPSHIATHKDPPSPSARIPSPATHHRRKKQRQLLLLGGHGAAVAAGGLGVLTTDLEAPVEKTSSTRVCA